MQTSCTYVASTNTTTTDDNNKNNGADLRKCDWKKDTKFLRNFHVHFTFTCSEHFALNHIHNDRRNDTNLLTIVLLEIHFNCPFSAIFQTIFNILHCIKPTEIVVSYVSPILCSTDSYLFNAHGIQMKSKPKKGARNKMK